MPVDPNLEPRINKRRASYKLRRDIAPLVLFGACFFFLLSVGAGTVDVSLYYVVVADRFRADDGTIAPSQQILCYLFCGQGLVVAWLLKLFIAKLSEIGRRRIRYLAAALSFVFLAGVAITAGSQDNGKAIQNLAQSLEAALTGTATSPSGRSSVLETIQSLGIPFIATAYIALPIAVAIGLQSGIDTFWQAYESFAKWNAFKKGYTRHRKLRAIRIALRQEIIDHRSTKLHQLSGAGHAYVEKHYRAAFKELTQYLAARDPKTARMHRALQAGPLLTSIPYDAVDADRAQWTAWLIKGEASLRYLDDAIAAAMSRVLPSFNV